MTTMNKTLLQDQFDVLHHSGGYTEIRDVKTGQQIFAVGLTSFEAQVRPWIESKKDIYVGINARDDQNGTTGSIEKVSCLVIDIDPVRPKDTASTDKQLALAIAKAQEILIEYTNSILVSSGSGAHVYIPIIEETVDSSTAGLLHLWGSYIKNKYSTKELKIDSIFDLPRVIRVWGSWNTRSNRMCAPLYPVEQITRVTFSSILETVKLHNSPNMDSSVVLSETDNRFERLLKINGELQNIITGRIVFNSRSESDYAFTNILLRANFRPADVAVLLLRNSSGRGADKSESERIKDVERISKKLSQDEVKSMSDSYFDGLDSRKPGIMTGFTALDQMIAGLKPGRLYVIAARPTDGKTTFITQIAKNVSKKDHKVLLFPTEVGSSSIYDKILSSETGINLRKFQFGNFDKTEKQTIQSAKQALKSLPLFVVENFSLETKDVSRKIKQSLPDIVIIDFLQSMHFPNGGEPRELSQAVVEIKSMAEEYQIPVILASQLHRAAEGAKTSLTQLKGTGALEEQGDEIIYLYTLDKMVNPRPVNLDVMKSKYGETGIIKLDFYSRTCEFREKP